MSLYALGGGELIGDKLVRYAYLDESGIGDPEREPYVIVAGVIVHADKQLRALEKYLKDMVIEYVPEDKREGFVFHAKELRNGGGVFDRGTYPEEKRLTALEELCSLPKQFELPVVLGFRKRSDVQEGHPEVSAEHILIAAQTAASTACLIQIERLMRSLKEDEVATLVYENNDSAKKLIKETHNFLKKDTAYKVIEEENFPTWKHLIPLKNIAETAFFVEKNESSILQVADAIAFTLNRKFRGESDADRYFKYYEDFLLGRPRLFGPAPSTSVFVEDSPHSKFELLIALVRQFVTPGIEGSLYESSRLFGIVRRNRFSRFYHSLVAFFCKAPH